MPGKCKFQESWLSKDAYKEWLVKDTQDIHFARCRACCKSIKLQTMGEAALTSHAGGAGHKAAVRKLVEAGNLRTINVAGQMNGSLSRAEDSKDHVAICLQRHDLDKLPGNDWADLQHSPASNSSPHNAELPDASFPTAYFTAAGTSGFLSQRVVSSAGVRTHDAVDHQQRAEVLEQQQHMRLLEWENRMKVLAWEQELVREKMRAARQKVKAFRMKKNYYKAKLKRMGEPVPPSSPGSSDEERGPDPTG
ncbi:uncharacterized protein LOC133481362 isoform X1 [Phyllopteryx taeniolatus]|uniref:uncharacterized protein LOC133481362 isoform X1 n=1 Tax=Phyllopteryx taeniolatus TaxID=161469 RepID=UPI002AD48E69|nr:uncharacterized protein LOC133481362 isoform X1 [Phyllopteryx taeniolatus]